MSGPDLGVGPGLDPDLTFIFISKVVYYTYTVSNIIFILIYLSVTVFKFGGV